MRVAISLSIGRKPLYSQVILWKSELTKVGVTPIIILAGHSVLDPKGINKAIDVAKRIDNVYVVAADQGSWSTAYLKGWLIGANHAEYVISADCDGAHLAEEVGKFVRLLRKGHPVVLGSRFCKGGIDQYPPQRRVVSRVGTLLANLVFSTRLTDYASGYEAMHSDTLNDLFAKYPPESWISARTNGVYHLQNTELRLRLCELGIPIIETPIRYGVEKEGKNLETMYVLKALRDFSLLVWHHFRAKYF